MGIERGRLIGALSGATTEKQESDLKSSVLVNVYSGVAACSSGDVPSADEFLLMREADVEAWIDAAKKLNPRWFAWMDDVEASLTEAGKKAIVKKKGKKPVK